MRIGVETDSFHLWLQNEKMDIFSLIEKTAEMGFEGLMINIVGKKNQMEGLGALGKDDNEHLKKVKEKLDEHNFFVQIDTRGTDFEHLKRTIEIADMLGAEMVRTFVMPDKGYEDGMLSGQYDKEAIEKAAVDIKQVLPLLEKYRMYLGIENHELETSKEIVELIESVDSKWLGFVLDIGNAMMVYEEPVEATRTASKYAISTHIKDNILCEVDDVVYICGMPLSKGNIDVEECLRILYKDSNLKNLIVEQCYPYCSVFSRPPGTGGVNEIGKGAFALGDLPYPVDKVMPLDYYQYEGELFDVMLQEQMAGVKIGLDYIKSVCSKIEKELELNAIK